MRTLSVFFAVLLFSAQSQAQGPGSMKKEERPFSNSQFAVMDGIHLHYRVWTPAQDILVKGNLLLVHGMGASTWSWEENAPVFAAEGYRVYAVDVPPYGFSDKHPDLSQRIRERAGLLWDFLDHIRPDSDWVLIGHSMGGGIVQGMAILNPEQTERVIFVDPALFLAPKNYAPSRAGILRFRPFEWVAAGVGRLTMIRPKKIRELLVSAYGQEPPERDVVEYHRALSQRGTARALIRGSVRKTAPDSLNGTGFQSPALAIWGDRDTWVPLEGMRPVLEQLPTIQLIVIEGAGHCPMNTHIDRFNHLCLEFLRSGK